MPGGVSPVNVYEGDTTDPDGVAGLIVKLTVPLGQPLAVITSGVPTQTVPLLVSVYVGVGGGELMVTMAVPDKADGLADTLLASVKAMTV